MSLDVRPLTGVIGAEIVGLDLARPLARPEVEALYGAWLDHIVLVFRGQALAQEDLIRVTGYFGEQGALARPAAYRTSGQRSMLPGIMLISNIRENGEPIGALPDGDMTFHHDMLHAEVPDKATLLYAVEIPSRGGNTLFADGHAAYETLDDDLRAALEGRRAFNHYNFGSQHRGDDIGTPAFAESVHPVFRTHPETGRKAVYVNRLMTERVIGLAEAESEALLARLFDHAERLELVYEHVWRTGDLVVWDNRCSMHARTDFPAEERRLMWRTTVRSDDRPH